MDRIIDLPNDVICHIGCFLSAKEALLFTTLLSRKWLNLFTIEPGLAFDDSLNNDGSFQLFVDGLLGRDYSCRVRRFSLKLRPVDFDTAQYNLVNDCLRNVLKRGVIDLELDINVKKDYPLPSEVFTCNSVVTLKLGSGFVIDIIPENALLPALKTLVLDSVRFYGLHGCVFQRLLSACPVLQELVIDGRSSDQWNWSRTVSSQILKRLTIRRRGWYGRDEIVEPISFDTPRLEYLEYFDVLRVEYPVVYFNALVEAKLGLPLLFDGDGYDLTNLFKGLKNIQILSLDHIDTMLLFYSLEEAVPVFENLFHLSVKTEPDFCWSALEFLLEKSPNLKTLTIEGTLHYEYRHYRDLTSVCECLSGYSFLKSCSIETLKITEFYGYIGEMVQIKHVLQNLPCLELLEVHVPVMFSVDEKLQIMSDLLMLPRASSKCKVQVKFS